MHTEIKKQVYSWDQYAGLVKKLKQNIARSPDVIVSIGRGGSIPGVILSELFGVVNLNFGMKSYANFTRENVVVYQTINFEAYRDSKLLVVDDLTDSGNTLEFTTNILLKNYCENIIFPSQKNL